jgi:hypothetical protein
MQPVDSGRVTRTYVQKIEAPPERVFPLLCPVREGEWLDGWRGICAMVHSDSGVAEEGCVFRTNPPGSPETIWMITKHDAGARAVEFFRVTTGITATHLTIRVHPAPDDASAVEITYTFTPLGDEGRRWIAEHHSEEAFRSDMAFWEASMNHWLATGETLRRSTA